MSHPPPIRIEDYTGTAEDIAGFVSACWDAQFPDDVTCPQWDADHFRWQMLTRADAINLAAYVGDRLVGFIYGEPIPHLWKNRPLLVNFSTVLAADPALKGRGVAKLLAAALKARVEAGEHAFMYGFAVPGAGSLGPKFWQNTEGARRRPGIRPWIRPLDGGVLAQAAGASGERLAARLCGASGIDRIVAKAPDHLRPYRPDDLDACLDLIRTAEADADLRYDWSREMLAHQLDFDAIPTTLVYDDGQVRGVVNGQKDLFRGAQRFSAGMVNHLAAEAGNRAIERALMRGILQAFKAQGHVLAICPSSASAHLSTRLRHRFVPLPDRYDLLGGWMSAGLDFGDLRRLKVHLG